MDFALGVVLLVSLASPAIRAAPSSEAPMDGRHVRTMDPRLREVIDQGVTRSELFRDLVSRLDASDVIVYAERECSMPEHLFGRLSFMTAAGGRRFVAVRIGCKLLGPQQIASLGHELQHALEIANAPSVVDELSMAAEYRRIGFASRTVRRGFDSSAAIEAGARIWAELAHTDESR